MSSQVSFTRGVPRYESNDGTSKKREPQCELEYALVSHMYLSHLRRYLIGNCQLARFETACQCWGIDIPKSELPR